MNFTPQQLAGGVRYGSKTRVGNWLEDVCLEVSSFIPPFCFLAPTHALPNSPL
jgi:hypothetical protein